MFKKCWFTSVVLIILAASAPVTHAYTFFKMPTTEKIKVLDTDHFKILYQAPLADAAPVVAGYFEEAYFVLTSLLDQKPSETIRVYLTDAFDTHNGWATVVPRNTIAIYLSGTGQGSQIYQPGNYLRRTIYHELMHLLSMDMRSGYNKVLEKIFGKIDPLVTGGDLLSYLLFLTTASPNMLAPNWYLEGIAMYAETEFVGPGRGQSTLGDMLFRTAVKDNNLIPYSQWYLETPRWPYGSAAYWYGMRLIQYLSETSDHANPVGNTTRAVSDAFLFNFNSGIRSVTQTHWKRMAREMLKHELRTQNANLQTLETVPFTPVRRLTPKTMAVRNVRFAGNTLFVQTATEEKRNTLYAFNPTTGALTKIGNAHTPIPDGSLSATADGRYLYYTNLEIIDTDNLWYEVCRYDTQNRRSRVLTRRGRYRWLDISPDGAHMAAVSQRQGITYLLEVPVDRLGDPNYETVLATTELETDLAAPRYSPDGNRIVYVEADGRRFTLKMYHRATGKSKTLWQSPTQIIAPCWHPDGNEIVFGSDANGVHNLYRLSVAGTARPAPVTHVWGGLFFPSFSQDGRTLAAVNYDGFGPHLVTMPYKPKTLLAAASLPKIKPRWQGGKTAAIKTELQNRLPGIQSAVRETDPKNYHSITAIRPDFWTPWASFSTYGGQGGLAAGFSDPAKHQELVLIGGVESEYSSPLALVSHTYRGLKADINLYAGLGQQAYPDLLASSNTTRRYDYAEETQFAGAAISFPLLTRLNRQLTFNVGYKFLQRDVIDDIEEDYDGVNISVAPTEEDEGTVWGRLDYFSGTVHGRSISIEDGSLISIGADYSDASLGGDIEATRVLVDVNQYISMPWLKNHVLKISGTYGEGWGDDYAQGLFGLGGFSSLPAAFMPGIARNLGLRGYDTNYQTGQSVVRAGAAYRFPMLNFSKGIESGFPFYSRNLFVELFYEGGRTYDDLDIGDDTGWLNSAGLEVNFGMTLTRFLQFAPGIGVVYAPERDDRQEDRDDDEEEDEVVGYITIKMWYNF